MEYDFKDMESKIEEAKNWLIDEFKNIRTGQASISVLDPVRVDAYGALSPINQVAAIGIEDARTIKITPWDKSVAPALEKALTDANLGVGVVADSSGIRVTFPELTGERREELAKFAKAKLEEARVKVRQARDATVHDITRLKKEDEISEDQEHTIKEAMEKVVKAANEELESFYSKKEQELVS